MKKLSAILMALVMLLSVAALAEAPAIEYADVTVEVPADYVQVALEDLDSKISLPADWVVAEPTAEQTDAGVMYVFASADTTKVLTIAYHEFDSAVTDADIAASYINSGLQVSAANVNEIPYLLVDNSETQSTAVYMWNDTAILMLVFTAPAGDADISAISQAIIGSFC